MPCINYITNLPVYELSGGWSGMNHHVYNQLKSRFEINLIEGINPACNIGERVISKVYNLLGLPGVFPTFSNKRLNHIKQLVESRLRNDCTLNFYHGSTSWLNVNNRIPYAMYLDASFGTYISVYHDRSEVSPQQLGSIYKKEAAFLDNAKAVFFSSEWSMQETKKQYDLVGNNFYIAGLGGAFENVKALQPATKSYFLFVGLDFKGKGGDKVVEAFKIVVRDYPDFKLKIVGENPGDEILSEPNIEYEGLIDKSAEEGMKRIVQLFANAYCFVMPTQKDMTPLVLVEAGSVGCPVISIKNFGVPEIVKDGETGILINKDQEIISQLVEAMMTLCTNRELHHKMRMSSFMHTQQKFTWNHVGKIIYDVLKISE